MKNLLAAFDETRIAFEAEDDGRKITAWYDVTDVLRYLIRGGGSVLEYAEKVEMDLYHHYQFQDAVSDWMECLRKTFAERIQDDYDPGFGCCMDDSGAVQLFNDAGRIRVTFRNGAVLTAENSEWGSITLAKQ